MNIEVRPNGSIIAFDTQVGRLFGSWQDFLTHYGSFPNYSLRIDP